MPRKRKTKIKALGREQNGQYFRNLGWLLSDSTGRYSQKKFRLGHDEDEAKLANAKLEALWLCIERKYERDLQLDSLFNDSKKEVAFEVSGNILRLKRSPTVEKKPDERRPTWSPLTLEIADAIRNGEPIATISEKNIPGYQKPTLRIQLDVWLSQTREDYGIIHIELANRELSLTLNEKLRKQGLELKEKSQNLLALPVSDQRLHQAIETYKLEVQQQKVNSDGSPSEWAKAKVRQISFIADHTQNLDLSLVAGPSIETILETLRGRPFTKKGVHCSKRHAANCIKEFRVFLEWLDESEKYSWNWPSQYEFKRGKISEPTSSMELATPRRLVKFNTIDELKTLYTYATPLQRVIQLLGLNCGFINAESGTLLLDELFLEPQMHPDVDALGLPHDFQRPWIVRQRRKTNVYGTWNLWPQTVEAIQWWIQERDRIRENFIKSKKGLSAEQRNNLFCEATKNRLLITTKFKPMVDEKRTGAIPNRWNALRKVVKDAHPDFNSLSIKYLRKSGSTLIRRVADGEVASLYLSHDNHGSDKDLDIYAAKPFAKLFKAIDDVHELLQPLWNAVPEPFAERRKFGGKEKLSPDQKRKITKMLSEGVKPLEIAEETGVHVSTIYRQKNRKR